MPVFITGQATFIRIGEERGLSSMQITDLYQDSYGFVWIGTAHGLNRFDGNGCMQFFNLPGDTNSISSNHISPQAFWEDRDSNLWVATYKGGLNFFDRDKEQFISYRADDKHLNNISMDKLFAIEPDGKGGLWIATAGRGFNHYNAGKFKKWNDDEHNPGLLMNSTITRCLKQDKNSVLWIGTNNGVCRFDPKKEIQPFEYFPYKPGSKKSLSDSYVTTIIEDRKGNIWLGTANGLNRWDSHEAIFVPFFFDDRFPGKNKDINYIHDILEDDDGKLWLGTNGGLLLFNPADSICMQYLHEPDNSFSIQKGPVNTIMKDRTGNIWLGTNNGISILNKSAEKLNHSRFKPIQQQFNQITSTEGINAIVEASNSLWLATQTGIYCYNIAEGLQIKYKENFSALYYDKSAAVIYAGTMGKGFFVFDAKTFVLKKHIPQTIASDPLTLKGNRVHSFTRDVQGYIWVATDACLNRYNPESGELRKFFNTEKNLLNGASNTNLHLLCDREGNLWIASMAGLSKLSRSELSKPFDQPNLQFEHFQHQPGKRSSISSNVVNCLLESADGAIWIGTDAGLNRFDPQSDKWQWFFKTDGLPGNEVNLLVEDQNKNIWIGSPQGGLAKYDTRERHFYRYSKKDGLQADSFRPNAGLRTADGFVILGGRTGLVGFHPDSIMRQKTENPPLYCTDYQIFNQPVPVGNEKNDLQLPIYKTDYLDIKYNQKVLTFQFSALNFISPEKQQYRYKLNPFQRDWQYNGAKRTITYTNLDPGKYQLHVETSENGYDWHGLVIAVHVRSPWHRTWWAYLSYALSIGTILFFIRRFELRRKLAKMEALRLQELDLAKTRLYTNITHEFRTPLTVILGMEEQVRKDPVNWLDDGLRLIRRNGKQLLKLVNQMLDLSKLESGHLPLKLIRGDITGYLHYLTESFHSYADSKDIHLFFSSSHSETDADYDPEKLQHILSNLLSNAIKFTPAGGEVTVALQINTVRTPEILIHVSDTGPGISPDHLPHIFDRFYQADDSVDYNDEGTGIGLALVKELVKLIGGAITVESEPGKGTSFHIRLPLTRSAPPQAAPSPIVQDDDDTAKSFETQVAEPGDRDTVLLVEDNPDLITYMTAVLATRYRVLTARDGQEGIDKTLEFVPDVIISDVMMPVKDGFALCRELKSDERSSHIPIILLTAKADQTAVIEGLSYGADAYLPKPFHQQELLVRLEKLIELRRQLQQHYQQGGGFQQIVAAKTPSIDELFLQKVIRTIETHLSDEQFGMSELCKALNMSRYNLFRKIKALTGQSTTGFIRSLRLEKAKELLETTAMNVTEVCYEAGFNSPNYFSRIFQERYGMPPSEVRRR